MGKKSVVVFDVIVTYEPIETQGAQIIGVSIPYSWVSIAEQRPPRMGKIGNLFGRGSLRVFHALISYEGGLALRGLGKLLHIKFEPAKRGLRSCGGGS